MSTTENDPSGIKNDSQIQGGQTWVFGFKLALFLQYHPQWEIAKDGGPESVGTFYTNITKIFISLYGWGWDRWNDKLIGEVDAALWQTITDHSTLDQKTAEARREYYTDLRKVMNPRARATLQKPADHYIHRLSLTGILIFSQNLLTRTKPQWRF